MTRVSSLKAFRAATVAAAAFATSPIFAQAIVESHLLPIGITSIYTVPEPRLPPRLPLDGGLRVGRSVVETKPEAAVPKKYSPIEYAFFCFGPIFGNDSRGVNPNFMPPPTASGARGNSPTSGAVQYTRLQSVASGKTTWVGSDGSQITYRGKNAPPRGAGAAGATPPSTVEAAQASVEELIAENRREMIKLSWTRAYRRFPELEKQDSPEWAEFVAYLARKQSNPREAAAFESPMWPEEVCAEFIADRNWKQAEAESWARICTKVRVFNDPDSTYTRRFLAFAEGLRTDPAVAAIFQEPTWPERALELHDQRLGAVPRPFR